MKTITMVKNRYYVTNVMHGMERCQADGYACPGIKTPAQKRLGMLNILWPDELDVTPGIVSDCVSATPYMTELTIGTPDTEIGRLHANEIYFVLKRDGYTLNSQYHDKVSFTGPHAYLSNFWPCNVTICIHGTWLTFKNAEAAYHASKYPDMAARFVTLSGPASKKLAGKLKQTSPVNSNDWNDKRVDVMRGILQAKFSARNEELCELLTGETGDIIEKNVWYDTFWGTYDGTGTNMLGKLLMETRDMLRT